MKFFRDRADRHRKHTPGNMGFILPPPTGEWPGCPLLRASSDHRFIVGALRARRAPGYSPEYFLTNPSESVQWAKFFFSMPVVILDYSARRTVPRIQETIITLGGGGSCFSCTQYVQSAEHHSPHLRTRHASLSSVQGHRPRVERGLLDLSELRPGDYAAGSIARRARSTTLR